MAWWLGLKKHIIAEAFQWATYERHRFGIPHGASVVHGRLPLSSSGNVKPMLPICNLLDEMSRSRDASLNQITMSCQPRCFCGQLWTCGERLNKFLDPIIHFRSWWTSVTLPYKLMTSNAFYSSSPAKKCLQILTVSIVCLRGKQPPCMRTNFYFNLTIERFVRVVTFLLLLLLLLLSMLLLIEFLYFPLL